MSRIAGIIAALALVACGCGRSDVERLSSEGLGSQRWGANYFPNVTLTTHEGKRVRFFDDLLKDKVVVINFIYTSCPDACPLETAKLAEVQTILGDRVGKDTFFYSISIDPEIDTPEVLADYANRYGVGPGWLFLTGDAGDIALLRTALGLFDPDADGESNLTEHSLSILIGNQKTGRWQKASPMENSYVLATEIGDWLHNWDRARPGDRDYKNAPKLRNLERGEGLFRTRCATCHVVGGPVVAARAIGPDLLGVVERRERAWLERWLADPDAMLADGDPIAKPLFEQYRRVPMPNMRLEENDVAELIDFLNTETQRVRKVRPTAQPVARAEGAAPSACCQKRTSATVRPAEPAASSLDREPSKTAVRLPLASWLSIASGVALAAVTALLHWRASGAVPRMACTTSSHVD
jgi:protein SCO1